MISAIVLITADVNRIPEVAEAIVEIDGIDEVYSVTGDCDLVAVVHAGQHEDLADIIADRLGKVAGIKNTRTHIAFRTYRTAELDAAFNLGLD